MQVGQGQAEGFLHASVALDPQARFEQRPLRGLGGFLQLLRGGLPQRHFVGHQLVAGQGGVEQAAQAIVQAQRLRLAVRQGVAFGGLETLVGAEDEWLLAAVQRNAVVAQRFEKGQAIGVGRRRPVFEQVGATAVVGSGEVLRRSGVGRHREKGGQDQDTGMERAGEEGKGHAGVPGRRAVWPVPRPLPEGRGGR
ncbi:hypothetical protein K652_03243 [Pseudomonas aeruginosa VRFPA02]|nr:hypothetical protein K652_03243 [Pseudomonas aeruginosa VRFPA02]SST06978.1 Uncharacterised protein [Acinetobacter baumannii]